MLRFLGAIVIVLTVVGAIGWCFDWYEADLRFTIQKEKIKSDFGQLRQAVTDLFKQNGGCCDGH